MSSLVLKQDAIVRKFMRENLTLDEVKRYIIDKKIFDESELQWPDFYWRLNIEMAYIFATPKRLEEHFGFTGEQAMHNFLEKRLKQKKEGTDYIKVGRDNILVQEYFLTNSDNKTLVFYLLSSACYTECLMDSKTEQAKSINTYLIKMNFITLKIIWSVLVTKVEDQEIANVIVNEELENANDSLESSTNMIERMNSQYERELLELERKEEELQKNIDILTARYEGLKNEAAAKKNSSKTTSSKLDKLLGYTASSCRICDMIVYRVEKGKLTLDFEIPDIEIQLATPSYSTNAFRRMKSCILDKKAVPEEIFSIVEKSCVQADLIVSKLTPSRIQNEFKIQVLSERHKNPKYAQDMFKKLVKMAKVYLGEEDSSDEEISDFDEFNM